MVGKKSKSLIFKTFLTVSRLNEYSCVYLFELGLGQPASFQVAIPRHAMALAFRRQVLTNHLDR